ncbi:MAG: TRAP transporter substrate-binding protein [Oscillospiraceae bacterium]|nr:TRAP transporter substrate-binding protein [Oscillospiraceae bacterium]
MIVVLFAACGGSGSQTPASSTAPASSEAPTSASAASPSSQAEAPVGQEITIRVAHQSGENENIHMGLVKFKEEIEAANVGIKVEIFPNKQLISSDRDAIEATQLGEIHMTSVAEMQFAPVVSEFYVFNANYLFSGQQQAKEMLEGAPGDMLKKAAIDKGAGVRVATFFGGSLRGFFNNVRELRGPDDFKGIKMRTAENPINVAELTALGCIPTPMAGGELYTGLQQGAIEGYISATVPLIKQGMLEVLKYVSDTNQTIYIPTILINEELYQSFSPEQLEAYEKAIKTATDYQWDLVMQEEDTAKETLREEQEKGNVIYTELTDEERNSIKEVMVAATEDMVLEMCGEEIFKAFRS